MKFCSLDGVPISAKEAPSWASNPKYKKLPIDSFRVWYELIFQRVSVYAMLQSRHHPFQNGNSAKMNFSDEGEGCCSEYDAFLVNSDLNLRDSEGKELGISQTLSPESCEFELKSEPHMQDHLLVRALTLQDLYFIEQDIKASEMIYKGSSIDSHDTYDDVKSEKLFGRDDYKLADSVYHSSCLSIDTSKSEKELIQGFTKYVKSLNLKKLKGSEKTSVNAQPRDEISKIRKYNVLLFMDLWMWAYISGQKITNEVMCELLFDSAGVVGDSSYISKYVRPLASKLISGPLLPKLKRAAQLEVVSK